MTALTSYYPQFFGENSSSSVNEVKTTVAYLPQSAREYMLVTMGYSPNENRKEEEPYCNKKNHGTKGIINQKWVKQGEPQLSPVDCGCTQKLSCGLTFQRQQLSLPSDVRARLKATLMAPILIGLCVGGSLWLEHIFRFDSEPRSF
jgi:hypothetical protein